MTSSSCLLMIKLKKSVIVLALTLVTLAETAVASLVFAASRCGEMPELYSIRILFRGLLGQEFERANVELLPANRVNSQIKHNLSRKSVAEDLKIQLLNEIATENKQHLEHQIKVPAQKEILEATVKYERRNFASYDQNVINAHPQASNFKEMLQSFGSKIFFNNSKNMLAYWSYIPESADKIAGSFTSAEANATVLRKRHHHEGITNRVASFVSASKAEGAFPCLDKEKQSSKREDSRRRQELNASETCMSFKRSKNIKASDENGNGMISQALKNKNVYSSQDAGDIKANNYDKDRDTEINSPIRHVHPKLPDYDDLVAKFIDLKKR